MNIFHLFVKVFGGSFFDSQTMITYFYKGSLNIFFIGLWIDIKLWLVRKYYAIILWWLRRKIKPDEDTDFFFCRYCMALHEEECCCSENEE